MSQKWAPWPTRLGDFRITTSDRRSLRSATLDLPHQGSWAVAVYRRARPVATGHAYERFQVAPPLVLVNWTALPEYRVAFRVSRPPA